MRDTFVRTLIELAKKDKNIELVTGDLGFGVLKPYWEALPDQFTNAGIAEQNMTTVAAGMALEGKTVFTYSIGNFPTLRCLEQIRNDCAYHGANVKIVCVGGGFVYGSLGMSHQATEDLAIMRALPDVVVMAPGDLVEAEEATKAIAAYPGTCYLRLGRGGEKRIHDHIDNFQIGKAIQVKAGGAGEIRESGKAEGTEGVGESGKAERTEGVGESGKAERTEGVGESGKAERTEGVGESGKAERTGEAGKAEKKVAIFSTGAIFEEVEGAYEILTAQGLYPAVYTFPTVKPIDADTIRRCAEEYELIVTCEEHNIVGGFGGAVAEVMAEMKTRRASLLRIGLNDCYGTIVGNQKYLREQYGMSAAKIAERIVGKVNE